MAIGWWRIVIAPVHHPRFSALDKVQKDCDRLIVGRTRNRCKLQDGVLLSLMIKKTIDKKCEAKHKITPGTHSPIE